MVASLLSAGADPHIVNKSGETALMMCVKCDCRLSCEQLLRQSSNQEIKDAIKCAETKDKIDQDLLKILNRALGENGQF